MPPTASESDCSSIGRGPPTICTRSLTLARGSRRCSPAPVPAGALARQREAVQVLRDLRAPLLLLQRQRLALGADLPVELHELRKEPDGLRRSDSAHRGDDIIRESRPSITRADRS